VVKPNTEDVRVAVSPDASPSDVTVAPSHNAGTGMSAESSDAREFLRSQGDSASIDRAFRWVTVLSALTIFAIVALILFELIMGSRLSSAKFGTRFFLGRVWNTATGDFGALPFIYGTAASSSIALVIAVPLALGVSIFLTEMCPALLRSSLVFLTDLMAAVPSVVYGLWGLFVLAPLLQQRVNPRLVRLLGWTGLVEGPNYGIGILAAGVILAIMVLPVILSLTREVMSSVPHSQREAVLALGATRWEMVRMGVLRNARIGILGAIILGLGRALGETMAVIMIIGNRPEIGRSLFARGASMATVIANEFGGVSDDLHRSALVEIGLILFVVAILVNALARVLVWAVARAAPVRARAF
jgi:phosphate transport system permease protein